MDASKPIIFYDIASGPPTRTYAVNPWKTRYALNFKGVNYKTEWVDLPDVTSVRKRLGAAPNRTLPDGSDFYTLPIIEDMSNGEIIGDSFEIAVYLDKLYPDGPTLVPSGTAGLQKAFNIHVDTIFTTYILLQVEGLPFNPATADISKAEFVRRAGSKSWDDFIVRGEARTKLLDAFKAALGELAKCYRHKDGPFLEGEAVSYADLIVGAWLAMLKVTLNEWEDVTTWHNGRWGNLHRALEKYADIK